VCVIAFGPVATRIHHKMRTTNTYYRMLLPTASADRMVRLAWRAYRMGRRVVVPGLVNSFLAWSSRVIACDAVRDLAPVRRLADETARQVRAGCRISAANSEARQIQKCLVRTSMISARWLVHGRPTHQ
jgi:hypothetical protein